MKFGMLAFDDIISVKFEFGKISIVSFKIIALDLEKIVKILLVNAIKARVSIGFG